MAAEIKTKGVKCETVTSASFKKKYKAFLKKKNISMAQRLRDLMQKDLKS